VGLVDLGGAPSLGEEGLLGIGGGGQGIALEEGDLVAGPPEGQRCGEPADAAPDDDHLLGHRPSESPRAAPTLDTAVSRDCRLW
jgi:hypothetical protein